MKHFGVLGGTRFIGHHLTCALVSAGHAVTIFTRGITIPPEPDPSGVRRVFGDRNRPEQVGAFLRGGFDVVYDLTAYTPAHVAPVLACRDAIGQYVLCSTSMVYRQPAHVPCSEDAALDSSPGTYGGDKARTEEAIREASGGAGWPVTIVRPHGVFGPLDPAQPGLVFARLAHSHPIVLNTRHRRRMNPVYVGDLVDAFVRIAEAPVSHGRVYNVAGPEAVDQRQLVQRCCETLGIGADIRSLRAWPYANIEVGFPWPQHDLVLSTDRIQRDLGVTFTSLASGLADTLRWLREMPIRLEASVPRAERLVGAGGTLSAWARGVLWTDDATSGWRARRLAGSVLRHIGGTAAH